MSESNAITGVVSSLKAVRDQYQQQLQNVPQYATFLRVQQLTEISPAALGIPAGTDGSSTAHDVVAALAFARDKFKEHLASVPEYRALLAIDKLIADLDVAQEPVPAPAAETPVAEVAPVAEAPAEQPILETASLSGVLGHHDSYDSAVDEALAEVPSLSGLPAAAEPIAAVEAEAVAAETPTVETTVGEVTLEPYPNVMPTAEQAAGEMPAESPGAERAA